MRPRVPLGCHLMLTGLSLSQVCSGLNPDYQSIPRCLLFYNELTNGDACKESLARKIGKLGGEIEF